MKNKLKEIFTSSYIIYIGAIILYMIAFGFIILATSTGPKPTAIPVDTNIIKYQDTITYLKLKIETLELDLHTANIESDRAWDNYNDALYILDSLKTSKVRYINIHDIVGKQIKWSNYCTPITIYVTDEEARVIDRRSNIIEK